MTEGLTMTRRFVPVDKKIGLRIRQLREARGMNKYQFPALVLGNNPSADRTNSIEEGRTKPRESTMRKIADYFDVPLLSLYGVQWDGKTVKATPHKSP